MHPMPGVRLAAVAVLMVLALPAATASADTVFVSKAGNDGNTGLAWNTAKKTVQAGLNVAASGDEVWVAAGTYVENIVLKDGVALYGGFAGNETKLGDRDWTANVTILDGNQLDGVVTAPTGATSTTRIDGFTIRNGRAYTGAGVYCYWSDPAIANNTITGNTATTAGGGIYCNWSSPAISGNTITGNAASTDGGGIYCDGNSSPAITGNTITNNSTGYSRSGGGICCLGQSALPEIPAPQIRGNTISANTGGYGAGIYFQSCSPTIAGNTIAGNSATATGGGISSHQSSSMIVGNTIMDNTSTDAGGGIYCYQSNPVITGNLIAGNASTASDGGGICCDFCLSAAVADNTLACNRADQVGGAICSYSSSPTIVNTIIAFNSSGIGKLGTGTVTFRHDCIHGNRHYNYYGLTSPIGTDGNIAVDPQFVEASPDGDGLWGTADDTYSDLHLLPGSPCIDAGDNADVPMDIADIDGDGNTTEPLPIDPGGSPRFADDPVTTDTGAGTAPIVDIGTYEYRCGDITGDGYVDVIDLLWLISAFGTSVGDPGYNAACDFDRSGGVDVIDLLYMLDYFGT